ncbi:uncharacterized protein MEPE_05350 [Melanopsichium pennsylvanicum]|uniref:Haem-binding uptake Tiki superfamily ChaN domain-containing protein n=2 Tax=Melanopsichium pennsylvanicum TaxID=63383 RepID=A0AAJ5C779_9BASI|nr:putative protein [Melanopsichium pennsylvanicum 4]SNX86641.1 uncharacterized protein MEPE_05350 [Melanopsichium pennsylvanicum]
MSTVELTEGNDRPLAAMSIASFIPKFTKPRLLTSHIPTYRHSFSRPIDERSHAANATTTSEEPTHEVQQSAIESADDRTPTASPSYVEWSKILAVPSKLFGSFQDLFQPCNDTRVARSRTSRDGHPAGVSTSPPSKVEPAPPRLIFFGEQHHQPQVMRAQLQALHALHQQCQLASISQSHSSTSSTASPIYRLHLVLEHFSVLDQNMLNSFSDGKIDPDELAQTYRTKSEEAFHIGHYMPLLMLAKELSVPIWGGFPPRSWAKQVFREGIDAVKLDEERRAAPDRLKEPSSSEPATYQEHRSVMSNTFPRSPLFTSWSAVTKIGAAHRSYLSGLMRPDLPPRFPQLPDISTSQAYDMRQASDSDGDENAVHHSPIYPTWLLRPHNIEIKGFGPAQTLKDSYLAHVTAWLLRGAHQDALPAERENQPSSHHTPVSAQKTSASPALEVSDTDRRVVNVVLVVCGLGHCEYGFGAPERVVQLLSQHDGSFDLKPGLLPYIIASKPLDSGIWLGYEHDLQSTAAHSSVTHADPSAQPEPTLEFTDPCQSSSETVQRWLSDPWGRKMADAVLLYDWIDDEPRDEADSKADGDQPTSD